MISKLLLVMLVITILLGWLTPCPVGAGEWVVDAGYRYESGDFGGDSEVDISTFTLGLDYYQGNWGFALDVPYLSVTGNEDFVVTTTIQGSSGGASGSGNGNGNGSGSGSVSTTTTTSSSIESESVTRTGLGDVSLSTSYTFFPQREGEFLHELKASVKLPTSSEQDNFGSGEIDYALELSNSVRIDNWRPNFNLGYRILGEPAGWQTENTWFYSLGLAYQVSANARIGLVYDYSEASSDGLDPSEYSTATASTRLSRDWRAAFEFSKGMTDNSAEDSWYVSVSRFY